MRPSRVVIGAADGFAATVAEATHMGVRMAYTLGGAFGTMFAVENEANTPQGGR